VLEDPCFDPGFYEQLDETNTLEDYAIGAAELFYVFTKRDLVSDRFNSTDLVCGSYYTRGSGINPADGGDIFVIYYSGTDSDNYTVSAYNNDYHLLEEDTTYIIHTYHEFDREGYDSLVVVLTYSITVKFTDPCPLFAFSFSLNTLSTTYSVIDPSNYLEIPLEYTVDDEYSCYEKNCGALSADLSFDAS
jgi:hypothetical protein